MFIFIISCIPQVPVEKISDDNTETSSQAPYALVTTASYSDGIGALATVDLETLQTADNLTQNIHSDAVSSIVGDQVYQLNRLGMDSIRIYDWGNWNEPKVEWPLGESSNPHDVERCAEKLFFSLYQSPYLPVYSEEGVLIHNIDLRDFVHLEDLDGSPEASAMISEGDQLFVSLNQLQADVDFSPSGMGTILQLDCETYEIVRSWETPPNPSLYRHSQRSSILVLSGSYGNRDGAIQILDIDTHQLHEPSLYSEELDSWFFGAATSSSNQTLLLGYDETQFESILFCGSLETGEFEEIQRSNLFFAHVNAFENTGYLATSEGIWLYDIDTCTRVDDVVISFQLSPSHISFYTP
ncbi:MAG: hypothetical protein VX278_14075 [Myxococcota bacterium]|nr:hypothetical protein [Myxococcota bacterium]